MIPSKGLFLDMTLYHVQHSNLLLVLFVLFLMASCSRPAGPVFDKEFKLTIITEGQGNVSNRVIAEADYNAGTPKRVELTAKPEEGWQFNGWSGDFQGDQNPAVITVNSDKELIAVFANLPTLTTTEITDISSSSALSGGVIEDEGSSSVTGRGVAWGTSQNPTITASQGITTDGDGLGSFTSSMNNLNQDTRYYVRAYATNSQGTAYGNQLDFTTEKQAGLPSVSTSSISSITETTAQSGGNVTSNGGAPVSARGVCWSDSQNPDKNDECTTDGSGTGEFISNITGLNADTRYFLRAYAENSVGVSFAEEIEFRTNFTENEQPKIEILSGPANGSTIDFNNPEFEWNGNDPDGEVEEYDVRLDGPEDQQFTTPNESHQFENLPNGSYSFQVRSIDGEGLKSEWASRSFTVDYKSPNWPRDTNTEVVDVTSSTGRIWMDRNLGANRTATSIDDEQAYGDLYQWGRAADGHEKRNSATTSSLSNTDQPDHSDFILAPESPNDWRSSQNDNLWQGIGGVNNPCPQGYRLPTEAEWEKEVQTWSSNDASGAFASPLKLTVAGRRSRVSGDLIGVDSYGRYWSSTLSDNYSWVLRLVSNDVYWFSNPRAGAFSVRCIKD